MTSLERYYKRKEMGICGKCKDPVSAGKTLCAKHLATNNERQTLITANKIKNGICFNCTKPSMPNYRFCECCLEKHNIHTRKVKEKTR
jgi:hypothetical protein